MNVSANITPIAARRMIAERFTKEGASVGSPHGGLDRARSQRLGEILIRMGKLTPGQVEHILSVQAKRGESFSRAAKRLRYVRSEDLHIALGVSAGFLRADPIPQKIPHQLVVARNPYGDDANKFRILRTRIATSDELADNKIFCVAGAHDGAPAPFTAVNLAASLAQLGRRVLIVDGELRRPVMHRALGVENRLGLADCLRGEVSASDAQQATIVERLDIITGGAPVREPQALLSRPALGRLIDERSADYDHVIVVTASFGETADGEFIWSAIGRVLVVAQRHKAQHRSLKKLHTVMRQADAVAMGAVLIG